MNWWPKLAIQFNLWFKHWYTRKRCQFVICFGPTKSSSSTISNFYFLLLFQPGRDNKLIAELSVHFGIRYWIWYTRLALSCFIHVCVCGKLYRWPVSHSTSISLSLCFLYAAILLSFLYFHCRFWCGKMHAHLNSDNPLKFGNSVTTMTFDAPTKL